MNETPAVSSSPRLVYQIGMALGVGLLVTITLADKSATRLFTWPWLFYGQILFAIPLLFLSYQLASKADFHRFGGSLDAGLIIFAGASILSASISPYREQCLILAWPYVSAVAFAYLVFNWLVNSTIEPRGSRIESFSLFLGGLFALFVVTSLSSWFIQDLLPAHRMGSSLRQAFAIRNEHPYGHSLYTAGFGVLAIPWLAALGWKRRGLTRLFFGVILSLSLLLVLSTSSRGGIIGLFTILIVSLGACLALIRFTRGQRVLLLCGAGLLSLGGILANPRLREALIHVGWTSSASESNRQRTAMLEAGIKLGLERPIFGYGPGAIPFAYPHVRSALAGGVDNVLELHNSPVQLWAELGCVGIASVVLVAVGIFKRLKICLRANDTPEKIWAITSGVTLIGYAATSLTDHQLDVPSFGAALSCFIAVLALPLSSRAHPKIASLPMSRTRFIALSLIAGPTLMLGIACIPNLNARYHFSTALDATNKLDWVQNALRAAEIGHWDSFYPNEIAEFFRREREGASSPEERLLYTEKMIDLLNESLRREPGQEYAHFNLGWLLLEKGDPGAAKHFAASAQFAPDKSGLYLGLGLSLLQQGQKIEAVRAFALEWMNDPQSMTAPFWEKPENSALRAEVATRTIACYNVELEQIRDDPGLRRGITYARDLTKWWVEKGTDSTNLPTSGDDEQCRFFRSFSEVNVRRYSLSPPRSRWESLYEAWSSPAPEEKLYSLFSQKDPFVAQLAHRLISSPTFLAIIFPPPAGEDLLSWTIRRQRTGYGVLRRQNDGMSLSDVYTATENRLVAEFFAFLFPPKGWLPAPLILSTLNRPGS